MEIAPLGKRAGTEVGSAPHAAPPIRAKAVKSYYVAYWVLHCSVVCTACYVTNCHGVQRYVVCIHNIQLARGRCFMLVCRVTSPTFRSTEVLKCSIVDVMFPLSPVLDDHATRSDAV